MTDHRLKFETLAVHAGGERDETEAVVPPLYLSWRTTRSAGPAIIPIAKNGPCFHPSYD
jgi:hypothetical protein